MANTTFYERGNAYHDSAGNPAIIKNGNELTFTDNFNAGGGGVPYIPPAYSTDEVNTGRKWVDGSLVYEKVFFFENGISIAGSGANIEESTDVNLILNAWASDGLHGYAPIQASVESGILKVFAINNSLTSIKYVTITYTKTPAEPTNTNTRTVKKAVKRG